MGTHSPSHTGVRTHPHARWRMPGLWYYSTAMWYSPCLTARRHAHRRLPGQPRVVLVPLRRGIPLVQGPRQVCMCLYIRAYRWFKGPVRFRTAALCSCAMEGIGGSGGGGVLSICTCVCVCVCLGDGVYMWLWVGGCVFVCAFFMLFCVLVVGL